jgi:chromosome segregation ATPase
MNRLEAALARFNAALDALESSVETALESAPRVGISEGLQEEVANLQQERQELLARIASLEEESESLAGLTEAVETRLDGAIADIRSVLGRG